MGIIDLNIKTSGSKKAEQENEASESTETAAAEAETETSNSSGRLRRTVGAAGLLALGVVGLLTFRKFRAGRKPPEIETELEDTELETEVEE